MFTVQYTECWGSSDAPFANIAEGKLASAITAAVNTLDYNISKETAFCLAVLQFIPGTPK